MQPAEMGRRGALVASIVVMPIYDMRQERRRALAYGVGTVHALSGAADLLPGQYGD